MQKNKRTMKVSIRMRISKEQERLLVLHEQRSHISVAQKNLDDEISATRAKLLALEELAKEYE